MIKNPAYKPLRTYFGPAKVCHPLKYIRAKDTTFNRVTGHNEPGPFLRLAEIFAKRGDGAAVQKIAMGFATA